MVSVGRVLEFSATPLAVQIWVRRCWVGPVAPLRTLGPVGPPMTLGPVSAALGLIFGAYRSGYIFCLGVLRSELLVRKVECVA